MKGENKRRINICYVQYVSKLYNHLDGRYTLQQKPNLSIAVTAGMLEALLEWSSHWAQKG